jgi:hypothetical protein
MRGILRKDGSRYPGKAGRAALMASISPLAVRDVAGPAAVRHAPVSDLYRLAA